MNVKNARAVELGNYIIQNACTVRELCERVRVILDYNLSVRHLRGGEATRKARTKHSQ